MKQLKYKTVLMVLLTLCISSVVSANNLIITKSFTGGWYDPAKNGQGFLLEIIKSNNQKQALTTWFTFDNDGNQFWLIGVGEISDQSIEFQMLVPQGGRFGDLHNAANVSTQQWGKLTFTFTDCNNGTAHWQPTVSGFSSGSMPITRNTVINNLYCTGGLFDELGDSVSNDEIITALVPVGNSITAQGKAKYQQRADRIDFSVEIEHVPVGDYELFVAGEYQADIQVVTLANGFNEGEVEFRDPVEPGKLLLDFNPVGALIEIKQANQLILTSQGGGQSGTPGSSHQAPPFGNSETELYMSNTGVYPLGQTKVKLEQRTDRVDFEVEIEDVPVGFYDLNVGGETQGIIEVTQTPAGVEGEIEFRNPVEAGKELLDFNPLGELITITQGSDTLFTLDFPSEPSNVGNDGSDDDDDCNDDNPSNDCDDDSDDDNGGQGSDDECDDNSNDDDCDDNGNGGTTPPQLVDIDVDFNNTGADSDASGSVRYETRSDRRDFKVEVEDLNAGTYQLFVGGQSITSFNVSGAENELEFRDPVEPGKMPLTFDPLNKLVEIKQDSTVYLFATVQ